MMSEETTQTQSSSLKKARYMSAWESSLTGQNSSANKLGLRELFGCRRRVHAGQPGGQQVQQEHPRQHQQQNQGRRFQSFLEERERDGFFTLRLEHREGGAMARHIGEEKILLFRSDRAGAIAKIIYSSTPADGKTTPTASSTATKEDEDLLNMAQAKIHVLDVKTPYRGIDLGGLLFSEAIRSLRYRYMDEDGKDETRRTADDDSGHERFQQYVLSHSIRCQLDAEEDVRRHNKLIDFYQQLGCQVKPKAKVQYINNNDGETYRKIPMQMALRPNDADLSFSAERHHKRRRFLSSNGLLVDRQGEGFLPVRLVQASGRPVELPLKGHMQSRRVDWLVFDDGQGRIMFRTTQGHYLRADPDGRCCAAVVTDDESAEEETGAEYVESPPEDWASFRLHRVSDFLRNDDELLDELDSEASSNAKRMELWLLESAHGTFLTADSERHNIYCSKVPAFWQADDDSLTLVCTSDTPPRRQHYRKAWTKQTVAYVEAMRERYLSFGLKKMSIRQALDLLKSTPYLPFRIARNRSVPSLRTLCFRTAEACRAAGHPDWVQFVAFVHELASVLNFIDPTTAAESEDDYDWTITRRSRVVGCAAPDRVHFHEFRHLNADEKNSRYSTPQGIYGLHCGLDNVLLSWTGPEYMYHMLRHNKTTLPEEGLAMLRYFPLVDWHRRNEYDHLANADDRDILDFAAEFDQIRRLVRLANIDGQEMSDEQCDKLWKEQYSRVVAKYVGDCELMW